MSRRVVAKRGFPRIRCRLPNTATYRRRTCKCASDGMTFTDPRRVALGWVHIDPPGGEKCQIILE